MPSYATVAELRAALGEPRLQQLTDIERPPLGLVNSAVAQRALDDASAEIDGYLVGRYLLPLAPPPPVLRVHCCTLAHYRLAGGMAEEPLQAEVKAVRQYLAGVAAGTVQLLPPAAAPQPAGLGSVLVVPGAKVMGRNADGEVD